MSLKPIEHEHSFGVVPLKQEEGIWKVLLILHQKGNHWSFPKGHGEEGESPHAVAERELKEETGLEISSWIQKEPLLEEYTFYRKGYRVVKTVSYFPALIHGELQLQEEEIRAARWLTFPEALNLLTFKEAKEVCQRVFEMVS